MLIAKWHISCTYERLCSYKKGNTNTFIANRIGLVQEKQTKNDKPKTKIHTRRLISCCATRRYEVKNGFDYILFNGHICLCQYTLKRIERGKYSKKITNFFWPLCFCFSSFLYMSMIYIILMYRACLRRRSLQSSRRLCYIRCLPGGLSIMNK